MGRLIDSYWEGNTFMIFAFVFFLLGFIIFGLYLNTGHMGFLFLMAICAVTVFICLKLIKGEER